jgi:WD40 repeat protein
VTFEKLQVLTGHSRAVQALALDPYSIPEHGTESPSSGMVIFSGDSNREIRAWYISPTSSYEVSTDAIASGNIPTPENAEPAGTIAPLVVHETSIFGLTFTSSGDLWTASADRSAKCLSRERKFAADTSLEHPDYVRCIDVSESHGVVVTGCRDEHVRVWDSSSGGCLATLEGHWEEVTGCAVLGINGEWVATVGIDGTLRRWSLAKEDLSKATSWKDGEKEVVVEELGSKLTEDEERELAELMDDGD